MLYINNSLHLVRNYARIFVRGHSVCSEKRTWIIKSDKTWLFDQSELARGTVYIIIYIELIISSLISRKHTVGKFSISAPVTSSMAADYTIIMSRTLKVTGNHVMYDRGA